jgi:hypothetical protein
VEGRPVVAAVMSLKEIDGWLACLSKMDPNKYKIIRKDFKVPPCSI